MRACTVHSVGAIDSNAFFLICSVLVAEHTLEAQELFRETVDISASKSGG